jgi:hypothetical protein
LFDLEGERIGVILRELKDTKAALDRARQTPANRAEVAVLDGTAHRVEEALKNMERLTVRMGATPNRELRRQYDEVLQQVRKGLAELDAGLARLAREGAEARREQSATVRRVAAVDASVKRSEASASESRARSAYINQTIHEAWWEQGKMRWMKWVAVLTGGFILVLLIVLTLMLSGK